MKLAGIILAAGRSSRMGRDKALLPYRGSTFLEDLAHTFLTRLDSLVVVLGHNAETIRASLPHHPRLSAVLNQDCERGMLSSLQVGLAALPPEAAGAVFTLVDCPGVREATLEAIVEAFAQSSGPVVIPRYRGARGHPIAVSADVIGELLALPPTGSPKQTIRRHRAETVFLDLDDPAVVGDIDTPADYERLLALEKPRNGSVN